LRSDEDKSGDVVGVGLADVLTALRHELSEAMVSSAGDRIRFAAESLEVELSVVVTREFSGNAGVRFWVIDAGGGYSGKREAIQKVNLRLKPQDVAETDAQGRPIGTAYVGGMSAAGEELPDHE
jgi:hypothetical protein